MWTRMRNAILGALLVSLLLANLAFADLPVVPGFSVEVYVSLEMPSKLCFAPDGVMYVGNRNLASWYNSAYRVPPGGGSWSLYGPPLWKAGNVGYDKDGLISGTPGTLLALGGMYSEAHFTAIFPDETAQTLWRGPFVNGGEIEFDSTGRMLFADVESRNVYWSRGSTLTVLLTVPLQDCQCTAIDRDDNIFISMGHYAQAKILAYRPDGSAFSCPILEGVSSSGNHPVACGKGGVWGYALYVLVNHVLMRFDSPLDCSGSFTTIGTGFNSYVYSDMEFGPDGALYIVDQAGDQILRIAPLNAAPVALCQNVTVEAGLGCTADASVDNGSYDPDGDPITVDLNPPGPYQLGMTEVTLTVTDDSGASDTCTATVTVIDTIPPVISLNGDASMTLECGIDSYAEPGAIVADNCDSAVSVVIGGDTVDTSTCGTYIVTYNATDASGNSAVQVTRTVTVRDTIPPQILAAIVEPQVVGSAQAANFNAVTDDECDPTVVVEWDFGDGSPVSTGNPATHTYDGAGIYHATLTVTDASGYFSTEEFFVVVYDPSAGFVTGGGWIWSPAGAYAADLVLEGKANFGFVSKYKKGASVPDGQTEFVFHAGDLNFRSSSYEWLVVTGSNYARFKGTGTINGSGAYKFMLWAGDGEPDTFRIKIWTEDGTGVETDVYDNGFEESGYENGQPIGGGSIVVHTN